MISEEECKQEENSTNLKTTISLEHSSSNHILSHSIEDIRNAQDFVNQLITECEKMNQTIKILRQNLNEKIVIISESKATILALEETILNLRDELTISKNKNEDLYAVLEKYEKLSVKNEEHPKGKKMEATGESRKLENTRPYPEDNLLNTLNSNEKFITGSTFQVGNTMKKTLEALEDRLAAEHKRHAEEEEKMQQQIHSLNEQLLHLMKEKEILIGKTELLAFSRSTSGLFSIEEDEDDKFHSTSSLSIGNSQQNKKTLMEVVQVFMDRLKNSDPFLLQSKLEIQLSEQFLSSFSNSIIDNVRMEVKQIFTRYQNHYGLSQQENLILTTLIEELCSVKRILNEFSLNYVVKVNRTTYEQKRLGVHHSKLNRIFAFLFGK